MAGNPFADVVGGSEQAPNNPFADLVAPKRQPQPVEERFDIDWLRPVEEVRAEVAKLPREKREAALRQWADAYVAREGVDREEDKDTTWVGPVGWGPRGPAVRGVNPTDLVRAVARGTLVGPFLDELTAKTSGWAHSLSGGRIGAPEDESLAYQRARDRKFDRLNPLLSTGAQITGGVASAYPFFALPATTLGRMAMGVPVGYGHGFTHGFGTSESDEPWERAAAGHQSGTIGAGIGVALPPVLRAGIYGVGRAADATLPRLTSYVPQRFGGGPDAAADAILAQRISRSGNTPSGFASDLAEGRRVATYGPGSTAPINEMLADLSHDMQRLTGSVYRAGGEAGELTKKALEARQRGPRNPYNPLPDEPPGQIAEVMEHLERALQVRSSKSAYRTEKQIMAEQKATANKLYEEARNNSEAFDLQPALDGLALTMQQHTGSHAAQLRRAMALFVRQGRDGSYFPVDDIRRVDAAKKQLDDMIERVGMIEENGFKRFNNLGAQLVQFKNDVLRAVHAAGDDGVPVINKTYAEARDEFSSAAESRNALRMGRQALREDAEVTADQFKELSSGDKQLFRLGLYDAFRNLMARKVPGDDVTRIFQQKNVRELLDEVIKVSKGRDAVYGDRAVRFGEAMARQERKVQTRNEVLGNSKTAQRQGDDIEMAGNALSQLYNRFRSSPGLLNMGIEALAAGWQKVFGFRQDVAQALARRLLETDPTKQAKILADIQAKIGKDNFTKFIDGLEDASRQMTIQTTRQVDPEAAKQRNRTVR